MAFAPDERKPSKQRALLGVARERSDRMTAARARLAFVRNASGMQTLGGSPAVHGDED
jgi:hypothetical protein